MAFTTAVTNVRSKQTEVGLPSAGVQPERIRIRRGIVLSLSSNSGAKCTEVRASVLWQGDKYRLELASQ